jgi:uracil-DNA glycosylase family 4
MADNFQEDLLEQVSKFLQYHDSLGIKEYPRTQLLEQFLNKQAASSPSPPKAKIQKRARKVKVSSDKKHSFDPGLAQKTTLNDIRQEIGDCHRCKLDKTRTNIIFGQGSETAKLMIIADSPGKEDDLAVEPLQGEVGELLDKMLNAINLSRDDIYITTLVKCFPGEGAKPGENEIKTCLPFLFRQIEIICPQVICAMGTQVSQVLLHSSKSLFQLRGRFYNFNDLCTDDLADKIILMPTLHPSLLLENPELKKASWHDLQLIQKKLEGK